MNVFKSWIFIFYSKEQHSTVGFYEFSKKLPFICLVDTVILVLQATWWATKEKSGSWNELFQIKNREIRGRMKLMQCS